MEQLKINQKWARIQGNDNSQTAFSLNWYNLFGKNFCNITLIVDLILNRNVTSEYNLAFWHVLEDDLIAELFTTTNS